MSSGTEAEKKAETPPINNLPTTNIAGFCAAVCTVTPRTNQKYPTAMVFLRPKRLFDQATAG
jgi:hypothetical protein